LSKGNSLPKSHAVQHRVRNEEQRAREINGIKQENHQLKRKLKRLQKEVRKRDAIAEVVIEVESGVVEERGEIELCPECGANLTHLLLAGKQFEVCGDCKYRKKLD
jgi:hypothetical protein